jgi:hypothetical protein
MEEEEDNRFGYLRLAQEAVRKRREKVVVREANENTNLREESEDIEMIKKCLHQHGDELEMYSKLQRLIEKNISNITAEADSLSHKSNLLMKRIVGYNHLMEGAENGNQLESIGMNQ